MTVGNRGFQTIFKMLIKNRMVVFILGIFLVPLQIGLARNRVMPDTLSAAPYEAAKKVGMITSPLMEEISGLAASSMNEGVLWVINDGGNRPLLFAVSKTGNTLATFQIQNAKNNDWEDLSIYKNNNDVYVVIADVGDNRAERDFCSLYAVKEPVIENRQMKDEILLKAAWRKDFKYTDGPKDCEAMAVDSRNNRILLLSKRTKFPILYELSMGKSDNQPLATARPIAQIRNIPSPTKEDLKSRYGKGMSWPTAMDLSYDGTQLIILTYKDAYYYKRLGNKSWKAVFKHSPLRIILPDPNMGELVQREAICIEGKSGQLFVTSEMLPAPIYQVNPKGR